MQRIKMEFSQKILDLAAQAETDLKEQFAEIDRIAFANTARVLDSFRKHRISKKCGPGFLPEDIRRIAAPRTYGK